MLLEIINWILGSRYSSHSSHCASAGRGERHCLRDMPALLFWTISYEFVFVYACCFIWNLRYCNEKQSYSQNLWTRGCDILTYWLNLFALLLTIYFFLQFLSLLDSDAAFNCEIIRDCYEAFALYCFERYLIACLGMYMQWPLLSFLHQSLFCYSQLKI